MSLIYLDWRPTPTVSYSTVFKSGHCSCDDSDEAWKRFISHCQAIGLGSLWINSRLRGFAYYYRSDGFFVFCVDHDDLSASDRINLSCVVSSFIKILTGHTHVFDKKSLHPDGEKFTGPLAKAPVLLEKSLSFSDPNLVAKLCGFIRTESSLLDLRVHGSDSNSKETNMRAVFRLRNNFGRLFDKTVSWCTKAKYSTWLGIPIFRRTVTFAVIYALVVFSMTVYEFHPDRLSLREKALLFSGGLVSSISLAALVLIVWGTAKKIASVLPLEKIQDWFSKRDSHLILQANRNVRKLKTGFGVPDILLWCFLPGLFLFPLKEMPSFFGILRRFGFDTSSAFLQPAIAMQNKVSIVQAQSMSDFETTLLAQLAFFSFAPLLFIYFIDVSGRRKKIVTAYRNLLGHLSFGSVLDASIDRLILSSNLARKNPNNKLLPQSQIGFRDAASIIRDRLIIEQVTRNTNRLLLFSIFALCFWYSFDHYWKFASDVLNLRGITTPVDTIIGRPPIEPFATPEEPSLPNTDQPGPA